MREIGKLMQSSGPEAVYRTSYVCPKAASTAALFALSLLALQGATTERAPRFDVGACLGLTRPRPGLTSASGSVVRDFSGQQPIFESLSIHRRPLNQILALVGQSWVPLDPFRSNLTAHSYRDAVFWWCATTPFEGAATRWAPRRKKPDRLVRPRSDECSETRPSILMFSLIRHIMSICSRSAQRRPRYV